MRFGHIAFAFFHLFSMSILITSFFFGFVIGGNGQDRNRGPSNLLFRWQFHISVLRKKENWIGAG